MSSPFAKSCIKTLPSDDLNLSPEPHVQVYNVSTCDALIPVKLPPMAQPLRGLQISATLSQNPDI
ncbi:hypothetical protein [Pseudorhodobacter wandonensis]|jgi:hypothetical protein|uniref:hypothetical protein n=1 Tax=Pseudorhodobacter wandonensis TaxID=1120568 RepID=UPI00067D77AE|nr:hypothetical protein [Pseudorhodobacter wandonensis]